MNGVFSRRNLRRCGEQTCAHASTSTQHPALKHSTKRRCTAHSTHLSSHNRTQNRPETLPNLAQTHYTREPTQSACASFQTCKLTGGDCDTLVSFHISLHATPIPLGIHTVAEIKWFNCFCGGLENCYTG